MSLLAVSFRLPVSQPLRLNIGACDYGPLRKDIEAQDTKDCEQPLEHCPLAASTDAATAPTGLLYSSRGIFLEHRPR